MAREEVTKNSGSATTDKDEDDDVPCAPNPPEFVASKKKMSRKRGILEFEQVDPEQEDAPTKRFKLVSSDSSLLLIAQPPKPSAGGDKTEAILMSEYVKYKIRPMTGPMFEIQVPKSGFLLELYEQVFNQLSIPFDKQVLSIQGQMLPSDEAAITSTPLPADCDKVIDLSVRMSSGQQMYSDDLYFDDEEECSEHEPFEVVVSLENLEEASKQLQGLQLLDTQPGSVATSQKAPTPEPQPTDPPARTMKIAGPTSVCHKCRTRCRPALQFTCKCGHVFCHLHRYHDQHSCPIDIQKVDRESLARANPKVVGERL